MAELLQMFDNINYFADRDYISLLPLLTVQLIAMSYHPQIQNLLYLLYARTFLHGGTSNSSYYQMQIWQTDKSGRAIVYNNTIDITRPFYDLCEMDVDSRLLLIQCYETASVFALTVDGKGLLRNTSFVVSNKTNYKGYIKDNQIMRLAAVSGRYYAFYNGSKLLITLYDLNDTNIAVASTRAFDPGLYNLLFSIFMSQDYLICAHNQTNTVLFFTSVPCIVYGGCSGPNITVFGSSSNITKNFKIRQANSTDQKFVVWLLADSYIYRYQISYNASSFLQQVTSFGFDDLTFNNKSIVFYTYNGSYQLRSFQVAGQTADRVLHNFDGNMQKAAINPTKNQLAVYKGGRNQVVNQYQIIQNCSGYNATISSSICKCLYFDGIFCSQAAISNSSAPSDNQTAAPSDNNTTAPSDNNTKQILPIPTQIAQKGLASYVIPVIAVGSAVAIIVMVILGRVIYKKFCKAPKNNRVPYQYDQVELMSFQM